MRVDAKTYYNTLPPLSHECGDIWRNLPSFGMLGRGPCAGIVITPACDLTWQKSDTVTYLPIVSTRSFFSMDAALPSVIERVLNGLQTSGCQHEANWSASAYMAPSEDEIAALERTLKAFRDAKQHSGKVGLALDRVVAGIEILRSIRDHSIPPASIHSISTLFGSEWLKIKDKIIRNNYSPAIHFLPADGQNPVFSGVLSHSVVLFRYPTTIPVKMLNYAQETTESSWYERVTSLIVSNTLKDAFKESHPVKLLSLRSAYLSDLLTRFSSLYNRIGSPDFSDETVGQYAKEMDI